MVRRVALLLAMLLLAPFTAQAQTAPVQVQFVGTITASASDTLMIRNADGTSTRWTGPLPDFPYVNGDQVTISFSATPGSAVQSADGLYRYTIVGPAQPGTGGSNLASLGAVDVSGPIAGGGGVNGLTLVYNAATGGYSLETGANGFTMWSFDGPGYLYDPAAGSFSLTSTTRQPGAGPCSDQNIGCFNLTGGLTGGAFSGVPVFASDGSLRGFFSTLFSGSWFVNGQQVGGGGATDVPEPGQLGLFALALLAVMMRRSRRVSPRPALA